MAETWWSRRAKGSTLARSVAGGGRDPQQLASQVKSRWERGEPADAAAALAAHPELGAWKSIVLDLAYEEFRRRVAAGETIDLDAFCARFPQHQASVLRELTVENYFGPLPSSHPEPRANTWPKLGEPYLGFSLVEELGRGSFARVYLAREPELGNRWVAVKVSPLGSVEAETLGKLIHPHIVPVYSVQHDVETETTAICMPYLGRATLCDLLDRAFARAQPANSGKVVCEAISAAEGVNEPALADRPIADRTFARRTYVDAVLAMGASLADALAHTHAKGVLHLDLKPSNVLLAADGRAMLLDFNLSLDHRLENAKVGGTLPYMSPEQIRSAVLGQADMAEIVNHRSDLFSLGVMLYQLLTGSLPFGTFPQAPDTGRLGASWLEQQRAGPYPLETKNRAVNLALAELIERCLEYDPARRPRSAAELAAELRSHLRWPGRSRRWLIRHRRLAVAAAIVACGMIVGATVYAATLPPYHVRLLQRANAEYRQASFERAVDGYTAVLALHPTSDEALWGRARAFAQQGRYLQADADLRRIQQLPDMGRVYALRSYCLGQERLIDAAIVNGEAARRHGFESAELLSNLGILYYRQGDHDEANKRLTSALLLNNDLVPARFYRARIELKRSLDDERHTPTNGIKDIEIAIQLSPPQGQFFRLAADLYAVCARSDRSMIDQCFQHIANAVRYGIQYDDAEEREPFSAVRNDSRFQTALATSAESNSPELGKMLLNPVNGQ